MEVIELKSKKELSNVRFNSYKGLERYLQDKGCLYTKQIIVNPTNNYSVDLRYLTNEGLKLVINLVNKFERNEVVLRQLLEYLFVTTNTYGKPFNITISAYLDNLKVYPVEFLRDVLEPKTYNDFPTLASILDTIERKFPLIAQAMNPTKRLFKEED